MAASGYETVRIEKESGGGVGQQRPLCVKRDFSIHSFFPFRTT